MIRYAVRTRQIVDLVSEVRRKTLNLSPFFQRNLVWRSVHKADFIETILKGYPFPQIFIARGTIDTESMISTSSIVDGQQRMSAVIEFVDNGFPVSGKTFGDLSASEKEEFLKYEVAVIDLDLKDDDPQIVEIFKRLNRTFYSLSNIERYSTEFATSEFMLVAKFLCGELQLAGQAEDDDAVAPSQDSNIPGEFIAWAQAHAAKKAFKDVLLDGKIFSPYETARMVHLMFTLNLLTTHMFGFYNRNEKTKEFMNEFSQSFPNKDSVVETFERAAEIFSKLRLSKGSIWFRKANAFSLLVLISNNLPAASNIGVKQIKDRLEKFGESLPGDYELAAKEAVNNRKERLLRNDWLAHVIFGEPPPAQP